MKRLDRFGYELSVIICIIFMATLILSWQYTSLVPYNARIREFEWVLIVGSAVVLVYIINRTRETLKERTLLRILIALLGMLYIVLLVVRM